MNNPINSPSGGGVSGNTLVWGVVVVLAITATATTLLAIFAPDSAPIATMLVANLVTAIPALLALAKISNVDTQVDRLANGLMDAKVRAGLADVLPDELIDPDAHQLIQRDRDVVRQAAHEGIHKPPHWAGGPDDT